MKQYKTGLAFIEDGIHSLEWNLEKIKAAGFDGIFYGWDHANVFERVKAARKTGLEVTSIHSPFVRVRYMWRENDERTAPATQELIDCVRDCAAAEVSVMVIHPFIGFTEHNPTESGLAEYGKVIDAANEAGVKLAFENVEGEEYLAALMKTFGNERSVGFCLDTGHEQCYNGGKDMMSLYGDKICYCHLDDNFGALPQKNVEETYLNDYHLVMGDGIVDWKGVYDRFEKYGYDGYLMCELTRTTREPEFLKKYQAMTFEEFLAYAFDRVKKLSVREL